MVERSQLGGLEVVDPRYRVIFDRAVEVFGADPHVVAVVPGGSIAQGKADAWSDLDLTVTVTDDEYDAFLGDSDSWLHAIVPTVFETRRIAPFIFNSTTDEGLTLDVVVYHASAGPPTLPTHVPATIVGPFFPTHREAVTYVISEFLRALAGPFVTIVGRGEVLAYVEGVMHPLGLLTTLFLAENGTTRTGVTKRLNQLLTDEQLELVAGLPPLGFTSEALVPFHRALVRLFFARARPLAERYEIEWPAALEATVAVRLRQALGIDLAEWLAG